MGNHEHYRGTLEKTQSIFEQATAHIPNFTVLQNSTAEIGDVKVFGTTLWTDCGGPANEWFVQRGMNDYKFQCHVHDLKKDIHQMLENTILDEQL